MAKSSHERILARVLLLTVMAGALDGCGSYGIFTLPPLAGSSASTLTVVLDPRPALLRTTERDLLNPSVVSRAGTLVNLYSEFDGHAWRTALASSADGVTWRKEGRVLAPDPRTWEGDSIAANGSALFEGGAFEYWYQAGSENIPSIGLARSNDARVWRKEPRPVLEPGPRGSWDERGVADPYVLKLSGVYYIYYLGQDRARRQQLGLARSQDGLHWTKLRSNPVLEIPWPGSGKADENGLGEPAVWSANGWYWMLYSGRNVREQRSLMTAQSRDGVHWTRLGVTVGNASWDKEVVCDPTVLDQNGSIRLWFGGGDVARPDENLNGQIGSGSIRIEARR